MKWTGTVETFEIHAKYIEEAKKEMTGVWRGFKSRFVDCISDGDRALISIETLGKLPIVQKRWDKYRIPPMEQRATGINALEYKMAQQEKRGRGRARGEIMGGYKILRKRVAKLEQYTAERLREAEKLLLRFAEYNLTPAEEDKLYEDVLEHQRKYKINAA